MFNRIMCGDTKILLKDKKATALPRLSSDAVWTTIQFHQYDSYREVLI